MDYNKQEFPRPTGHYSKTTTHTRRRPTLHSSSHGKRTPETFRVYKNSVNIQETPRQPSEVVSVFPLPVQTVY